jgi:hypothetical protein
LVVLWVVSWAVSKAATMAVERAVQLVSPKEGEKVWTKAAPSGE